MSADGLSVAGVQLKISPDLYQSEEHFSAEIEIRVRQVMEEYGDVDLIVFPEYTSAFLALLPYAGDIRGSVSISDALSRIESGGLACPLLEQEVAARFGQTLRSLLLSEATRVESTMNRVFGSIADTHDVYIAAGTFIAIGGENFLRPELRNRLVIYGPDGTVTYTQDKVFLTDFESDLMGISPGTFSHAESLNINGKEIGFTICRDTFLTEWEKIHADVDLWIDVKAEGEAYSPETDRRFAAALPARIARSSVPFGFTVCLNGSFFDLLWEGKSSSIKKNGSGVETLSLAQSVRDEEVLLLRLQ